VLDGRDLGQLAVELGRISASSSSAADAAVQQRVEVRRVGLGKPAGRA
jgi:hypothetical protein